MAINLYKHQRDIIDADPKKTGLFLGTGSGKTRVALMLSKGRTLVICPKTQKEDRNWEREEKNILMHTQPQYRRGETPATLKSRVVVMSKEEFRRDAQSLERFETVIVDEAHTCLGVTPNIRYRNKQPIPKASQLYEALEAYLARTKPTRLYVCTATIVKSPMTVWAAAHLLGRQINWYDFRNEFYLRLPMPGREVFVPKKDSKSKDALAALVREIGYVGRLEDFFDVPSQSFITRHVELTEQQRKKIAEAPLLWPEPIVRLGKINQIENGILSGDEFSPPEYFTNQKIERLIDYAAEFPRMIVVARYRAQIEQIASALADQVKHIYKLTGDTPDRGKMLAEVIQDDEYVLIVQAQMGAGWELPDCPVMIFASRTYSHVDHEQAIGRIHRANALKKNLYINLVARSEVDMAVDECLKQKKDFQERVYLGV